MYSTISPMENFQRPIFCFGQMWKGAHESFNWIKSCLCKWMRNAQMPLIEKYKSYRSGEFRSLISTAIREIITRLINLSIG